MLLLQQHRWTLTQLMSIILAIPAVDELPLSVGMLGVVSFLFASWRQFMEERRRQAEEQRKKELHDVKMQLLEEMKGKSPGEVGDMVDKLFD
jgi:hypothetical protein